MRGNTPRNADLGSILDAHYWLFEEIHEEYGDEMVKATEHLEEGITVRATGRDPDLQAVIRAGRLFAEQTLAQRRARSDRTAAASEQPKPLIRILRSSLKNRANNF